MVLQCINGVSSNPVEGRTKHLTAQKSNSNTVWFNFQTYIYILLVFIFIIYHIYIYYYNKYILLYNSVYICKATVCVYKKDKKKMNYDKNSNSINESRKDNFYLYFESEKCQVFDNR
jgi:hypothetical protein